MLNIFWLMTILQAHLQVIYWKINLTYQLLEMFDFFTEKDPLGGYANYVDQKTAEDEGLFEFLDHKSVYIGVDASNQSDADGRKTIRLHSKKRYNHGLFLLDLDHMPASVCLTWVAFWMINWGLDWPES